MEIDNSIFGVLNTDQLEKFCATTIVNPSDLQANFDGWRKLVLFTDERVFLFPRDPRGVEWLDVELTTYEFLNQFDNIPIPKFISRFKDKEISYYEFGEAHK